MLRVGAEQYAAAVNQPHARPMDFTGKPMKRMVYVAPAGIAADEALSQWLHWGINFAGALPPK
jgi:hypothetical protein